MRDDKFYQRADQHIQLSNNQISKDIPVGSISASMMYSTARFNAWMEAYTCTSGIEMKIKKDETVEYFVEEYRKMLLENLDDYIEKFDSYMKE
ncbi:MAG: DUF3144 domain-containing protein [Cyclobacteriaceae bacterium]